MTYYNTTNTAIYGLESGLKYQQNERIDELNERIASRQFPDRDLEPNYSPRPFSTKYAVFPILETKKTVREPLKQYAQYSVENNFNPGSALAPPAGYASNVEIEMALRNQYFALQSGDKQEYVPTANSDLYKVSVVSKERDPQPYPLLFMRPHFDQSPHPNVRDMPTIGADRFNNNTRTQLRNLE